MLDPFDVTEEEIKTTLPFFIAWIMFGITAIVIITIELIKG
ncbi:MAG: hypothetical protein WC554_05505 [Clostridia bacterium]|jgi:hypothetical protein